MAIVCQSGTSLASITFLLTQLRILLSSPTAVANCKFHQYNSCSYSYLLKQYYSKLPSSLIQQLSLHLHLETILVMLPDTTGGNNERK
uniref:Putative secreted protein n=1 Tax=Ixodes ricinus TaxID=34613 RepID=A0A6B0UAU9_IXORI